MTELAVRDILAVALGLGLATMIFRLGFAELRGRWSMPESLRGALNWVPVAALAAIVAPALSPEPETGSAAPIILAVMVAALITYRTRNLLASVGLGMAVYWLVPG